MSRLAVLLLSLASLGHVGATMADRADLRAVIEAYYYAIGENRVEEAMSLYHEDSPEVEAVRRGLELDLSSYLQRTSILDLVLVDHDGHRAIVEAAHRHLRISGLKFMVEFTTTRYDLRRGEDEWKIWSSTERTRPMSSPADGAIGIRKPVGMQAMEPHRRSP